MISLRNMAILAGLVGLGTWIALTVLVPRSLPKNFPDLPDLQSRNAELRKQIGAVDTEARAHPYSAESMGRLGMVYHANQFYAQAGNAYAIAARLDPNDYRWPYCEALIQEEVGQEKEMLRLLRQTLQIQPDYIPALQKLADFHFKQDQLDEAAAFYDRSLRAAGQGGCPQALLGLGRIAERRKDWRKVVETIGPLSEQHPGLRPPYQLLANAYEALGESGKAAVEQQNLLQSNLTAVPPVKDPLADALLDYCCSSTRLLKEAGYISRFGALEQALRWSRRAIEVEPGDADAHHFLARTLLDLKGSDPQAVDEALTHLSEGLRLRPDDLLPLMYAAAFFFKQKKTDAAVERLRTLLEVRSNSAEAHHYLGRIAERQDKPQEAIAQYQEALKRDPGYAESYERLGLISVMGGQLDQAIAFFRRAVQLKPSLVQARCNLGVALEQRGQISEAVAQYREAIREKSNDAVAHKFLAIALAGQGKVDEAADHFRQAARFAPEDAEARYGLALVLVRQGKIEEAVEESRTALRLNPGYSEAGKLLQQIEGKRP